MGSNCTFLIGGCPLVLPSPSTGRFAIMILLNQFNLQRNFSFFWKYYYIESQPIQNMAFVAFTRGASVFYKPHL
jgi:hypothetical protein